MSSLDTLLEIQGNLPSLTASDKAKVRAASKEVKAAGKSTIDNVRQLASRLTAKLFLMASAAEQKKLLNLLFDLVEDPSQMVRSESVQSLGAIAKTQEAFAGPICDVLSQLLASADGMERQVILRALNGTIEAGPKFCDAVLSGILTRVAAAATPPSLRTSSLSFFHRVWQRPEHKKAMTTEPADAETSERQQRIADLLLSTASSGDVLTDQSFVDLLRCYVSVYSVRTALQEDPSPLLSLLQKRLNLSASSSASSRTGVRDTVVLLQLLRRLPNAVSHSAARSLFSSLLQPLSTLANSDTFDSDTARVSTLLPPAMIHLITPADARTLLPHVMQIWRSLVKEVAAVDKEAEIDVFNVNEHVGLDIVVFERILAMFRGMAAASPTSLKPLCGIFVATGQPSDYAEEVLKAQTDFKELLQHSQQSLKQALINVQQIARKVSGGSVIDDFADEESEKIAFQQFRLSQRVAAMKEAGFACKRQLQAIANSQWDQPVALSYKTGESLRLSFGGKKMPKPKPKPKPTPKSAAPKTTTEPATKRQKKADGTANKKTKPAQQQSKKQKQTGKTNGKQGNKKKQAAPTAKKGKVQTVRAGTKRRRKRN
ncbi:MAG: hypothetical protein MHM6MM_001950 [Cercozoa sp. M6MM]